MPYDKAVRSLVRIIKRRVRLELLERRDDAILETEHDVPRWRLCLFRGRIVTK